jgi:hypothetical protein
MKSRGCPDLSGPVVIVAGGCSREVEQTVAEYGPLLNRAFHGFRGTVFSGGTTAGVAKLVGDIPASCPSTMRKVACTPRTIPVWEDKHDGYDALYPADTDTYSPLLPVQVWVDILSAGIAPEQVRVLGVNGGRLARIEFRLALAMGAKVGVIEGSGRASDDILVDPDWNESPGLLGLPCDPETVRLFVQGFRRSDLITGETRLAMAKKDHAASVEKRKGAILSEDRQNAPWETLDEDLRRSILQRIDHMTEKLRAVGMRIVSAESPEAAHAAVNHFTDEQLRIMAEMEHARWTLEKLEDGWVKGDTKDHQAKTHPLLVPWGSLDDEEKRKDYDYAGRTLSRLQEWGLAVVNTAAGHRPA